MRIYADTSGLFAGLVRSDRNHPVASGLLRALLERRCELHLTSYVLQETLALLQTRVGLEAARRFDHTFRPLLRVSWVDEPLHARAFRRLELRAARKVSLADCSSFVLMEELGIERVFGFDQHFEQEGFRLLRSPDEL